MFKEGAFMSKPKPKAAKPKIVGPPVPVKVEVDPIAFGVGYDVQSVDSPKSHNLRRRSLRAKTSSCAD